MEGDRPYQARQPGETPKLKLGYSPCQLRMALAPCDCARQRLTGGIAGGLPPHASCKPLQRAHQPITSSLLHTAPEQGIFPTAKIVDKLEVR